MNRTSTWIVVLVAAIVAVILARAYFTNGGNAPQGLQALTGHPAPDFPLRDSEGRMQSVAAYRGKVVVLNLWATWCPPCRAEMPDFERLYATNRARGLMVLGVDQGETAGTAAAFARALGITYPLLIDKDQQYGRVYSALGLPTTVVIDANGIVVRGFDGPLTYGQMQSAVAPLLTTR